MGTYGKGEGKKQTKQTPTLRAEPVEDGSHNPEI